MQFNFGKRETVALLSVLAPFWLVGTSGHAYAAGNPGSAAPASAEHADLISADKLVFAVDMIRHGDRTPIVELNKNPYAWPQGLGQLTPEGMAQEFALGTRLRKRYIIDSHLLPETYQPDSIYVRSSDVDRTLMSAECVLLGLYPNKGPTVKGQLSALPMAFQPIPVHTRSFEQDTLLVGDFNAKLQAQLKQVYDSPEWKAQTAKMAPSFAHYNEVSGMNITSLQQLSALADALHIRQLHDVPLPRGLSEKEAAEIIEFGDRWFGEEFKSRQVGEAGGHEALQAIVELFQQYAQKKSALKYVLFSGHDTTLANVMSALGVPVDRRPPYASDLCFRLYEGKGGYRVSIMFNEKPLSLPGTTSGACSLEEFVQEVQR